MRIEILYTFLLIVLIGVSPLSGQSRAEEPVNLYSVSLESSRDVEILTELELKAVFRGSDQTYLVPMSARAARYVGSENIAASLVVEEFERDDWVIFVPDHGDEEGRPNLIPGKSQNVVRTAGVTLVRSSFAVSLSTDMPDARFTSLPEFAVPFVFRTERALGRFISDQAVIDSIMSLVSTDSIESYVRRLEEFQTRYTYSDSIISAQHWLMDRYEALGCEVSIDSFDLLMPAPYGEKGYNVVADLRGSDFPDNYVILCNHYDAVVYQSGVDPAEIAPGADDNASGAAFCLEIARVLKDFDLAKTLRFISFSSEEQGLVGSYGYVANNPGQNIEVVINADMVGFSDDAIPDAVIYQYDISIPYYDFIADKMMNLTDLQPRPGGGSGRSDHYPFVQAGYRGLFVQEGDFNRPNYHNVTDLADNMDFAYMVKIVKSCAVAAYEIAIAPPVVDSLRIVDLGKSDRLGIEWKPIDYSGEHSFEILVGRQPNTYDMTFTAPGGSSSFTIQNLTEGAQYFVAVGVSLGDSLESIAWPEISGIPRARPDAPQELVADAEYRSIRLNWERPLQQDIAGFRIFRQAEAGPFEHIATATETTFVDSLDTPGEEYRYFVVAVDEDSNASVSSDTVSQGALFFDRETLVVITPMRTIFNFTYLEDSSVAMQKYRTFLADIRYDMIILGSDSLGVADFGRYRNIIWVTDGYSSVGTFIDELFTVSEWGCNLAFLGPFAASGIYSSDSDWFELDRSRISSFEFDYGEAAPGWPDLLIDQTVISAFNQNGMSDDLGVIGYYAHDSSVSDPIYYFRSPDSSSQYEGEVVGLYATDDSLKTVLVGVPTFHLTDQSGRALVNKIADEFGIPRDVAGDVNDDARYSLYDAVKMIQILFGGAAMPVEENRLDVNNDCTLDILDVQYLVGYIFAGGPEPTYGCIETE